MTGPLDGGTLWEWKAGWSKPPRFPKTPGAFNLRVRFKMQTEGFAEASFLLAAVLDSKNMVMAKLFQDAVIRSIVTNIRVRFLANIERGLEMKVLEYGRDKTLFPVKERFNDFDTKVRLNRAMEILNEAEIDSDFEKADRARKRVAKLTEQLQESLTRSRTGDRKYKSSPFSLRTGNLFRRRMMAVLTTITSAGFTKVETDDSGRITVGVGPTAELDRYETPSATMSLIGSPTKSRYRSLWRQLEFGTGARRSTPKERLNLPSQPPKPWWYGPEGGPRSLFLEGTLPMNFLTTQDGGFHGEDLEHLGRALSDTLDSLLTVQR
jgi:hypothetical protein